MSKITLTGTYVKETSEDTFWGPLYKVHLKDCKSDSVNVPFVVFNKTKEF